MELKTPYAFGKIVDMPYAEAERKVRAELAREGFGVLTEMDRQEEVCGKAPQGVPRLHYPWRL